MSDGLYKKPTNDELEAIWDWNLTNHMPTKEGIKKIETIRGAAKDFCEVLIKLCPESRERSLALTSLEQTVFNGVASIARYETDDGKNPGVRA
jgi:hypothetical protein